MAERVIPLVDERTLAPRTPWPVPLVATGNHAPHALPQGMLLDSLQRPLRDLRISVTDRCNFRCSYCMPKEVFDKNYQYLPQKALLSFEEITRLARSFLALGVHKIRLTGGEPLLRKNLDVLIKQLAGLQTVDGTPPEITLTTNGALLKRQAKALTTAGLQRITVSLDALDDALFQRMNDADFPVADVLTGIEAAQTAGLPVKVNMVVKRGINDQQILPMARHFRGSGVVLRFIEYMDVGATNGWQMAEVLPSAELIARLQAELPLIPLAASAPGETAARWGYADTQGRHDSLQGEIGVISSVTQAFCHECNRARLSTEGQLFLCLFASQGWDLRSLLRQGANEQEIRQAIATIWSGRSDRYSELRSQLPQDVATASQGGRNRRVEMSYIGG